MTVANYINWNKRRLTYLIQDLFPISSVEHTTTFIGSYSMFIRTVMIENDILYSTPYFSQWTLVVTCKVHNKLISINCMCDRGGSETCRLDWWFIVYLIRYTYNCVALYLLWLQLLGIRILYLWIFIKVVWLGLQRFYYVSGACEVTTVSDLAQFDQRQTTIYGVFWEI